VHQDPACRIRRKRGHSAQAIGRSRGGWTTKIHALTDVVSRPYALMLTPGNVSDIKVAPALLERASRIRYLLGDKPVLSLSKGATMPTACAAPSGRHALSPSFLKAAAGSEPFAMTTAIPRPPPRGERLLSPEGLPPDRYPLRQARG
ncbi:MAG: hypothetical protein EOO77_21490, partial [Oxalobacteraceae bacterium]